MQLAESSFNADRRWAAGTLAFVARRDHLLMKRVHRWPAPRWIRIWMLCATRGGDGWLWYSLGLALLLFGDKERRRPWGPPRWLPAPEAPCS